ncbi:c-type cytochrome [Stappia sp. F7233]|uniref:C-type cytochrome n=1 Tax=Stappia albiluteola TaxID=2758565 RepID=A0A839AHC4_9HYPH|nr:cytochrome c [Stappia albiluteola]MBA5778334.1 c-type cytochrome [Stappia albiluteola]
MRSDYLGFSCLLSAVILQATAVLAADDDVLKRGAYLMNGPVACGNCHTPVGPNGPDLSKELAGGTPFDFPEFMAFSANITPDPETGIGSWSDDQIARAIREGIRPDGTVIGPPMPIEFYRHLSDDDLKAIVAYLRHLAVVKNEVPRSTFNIPLPPNYGPPIVSQGSPSPDDKIAYGGYLVAISHCLECHTPRGSDGHLDMKRAGAGGNSFPGPWGVSVSRNITPDLEDGIGSWSDDEIKAAITTGVRKDGTHLMPPMAFGYYANITGGDLDAIVAYLRTLPPQKTTN